MDAKPAAPGAAQKRTTNRDPRLSRRGPGPDLSSEDRDWGTYRPRPSSTPKNREKTGSGPRSARVSAPASRKGFAEARRNWRPRRRGAAILDKRRRPPGPARTHGSLLENPTSCIEAPRRSLGRGRRPLLCVANPARRAHPEDTLCCKMKITSIRIDCSNGGPLSSPVHRVRFPELGESAPERERQAAMRGSGG
jgi:hypothetical protein